MNQSYTNMNQIPLRTADDDPIIALRLPYYDPFRHDFATVLVNKQFYETVSHLKWAVLSLKNDYCVSPDPHTNLSNPKYMHIMAMRYYQDTGVFGPRRLPPLETRHKRKRSIYTVDHINSANTLDNTKPNLRLATGSEQCHNRKKKRCNTNGKPCTSQYKGVSKSVRVRKDGSECVRWACDFRFGEHKARPVFRTEREAALAYNDLCMKHCPDFCQLNNVPENEDEDEDDVNTASSEQAE